jgi:aspartate-semialdehyde dehydrogenase
MKVAVIGASGLVGRVMLQVLEEQNFPLTELILVASSRSIGQKVKWKNQIYTLCSIDDAIAKKPHLALFSAGGSVSLEYAPKFAEVGCYVVDNSSAWRMDPTKKLIVPEINGYSIQTNDLIIANPNCSTIQMVLALSSLHKAYQIKRIVVSTYQSISGSGQKAMAQFEAERLNQPYEAFYPHRIDRNCLPQCDVFLDNDYTKEEMKLVNETQKIFDEPQIAVSATAVRVPVTGGHSESVNVSFKKPFEIETAKALIASTHGVVLLDRPKESVYPMPLNAWGKDEVFVGRVRADLFVENALNMWIVADNLRKGAATNAVQIAQLLVKKGFL